MAVRVYTMMRTGLVGETFVRPAAPLPNDIYPIEAPLLPNWEPRRYIVDGSPASLTDFVAAGLDNVVSRTTVEVLQPLVGDEVEFLPVWMDGGEAGKDHFLVHVLQFVSALDQARSNIARFEDGRILDIEQYAFHEEVLGGVRGVFNLPEYPSPFGYVMPAFVELVGRAGLTGVQFRQIYESGAVGRG